MSAPFRPIPVSTVDGTSMEAVLARLYVEPPKEGGRLLLQVGDLVYDLSSMVDTIASAHDRHRRAQDERKNILYEEDREYREFQRLQARFKDGPPHRPDSLLPPRVPPTDKEE